ncbi:MAG: class II aldolase/adducin family protein [Chitinispirillia bacterium]
MSNSKIVTSIYENFYQVGEALLRVNGNNTHSGNLSVRDPNDPDRFFMTASGSQVGELVPRDIVPLSFTDVSWGDGRASTESNIHRKILSISGVNASIHCHHILSTLITFDSVDKQLFLRYLGTDDKGRDEFLFQPVDINGVSIIDSVKVGYYRQPVGSLEMEERIPKYLEELSLTLIRGHGVFARGRSLEECLQNISVLETCAILAINLARRGVSLKSIQRHILESNVSSTSIFYSLKKKKIDISDGTKVEDTSTVADFAYWCKYFYNTKIGACGTGSMSQKVTSKEMIYSPVSSIPSKKNTLISRVLTEMSEDDDIEMALHKLIYNNTNFTTCIIASNPLATADGMAVLTEQYGIEALKGKDLGISYARHDHPVVRPIDAEAIYLNPRVGLVDITQLKNRTSENPILNMLRWHKGCCIVAGFGVIAAGDTTLEQAAHNISSAERIGKFRIEVFMNNKILNGPELESFEPKTI